MFSEIKKGDNLYLFNPTIPSITEVTVNNERVPYWGEEAFSIDVNNEKIFYIKYGKSVNSPNRVFWNLENLYSFIKSPDLETYIEKRKKEYKLTCMINFIHSEMENADFGLDTFDKIEEFYNYLMERPLEERHF